MNRYLKLVFPFALLLADSVYAESLTVNDLVGVGFTAEQATVLTASDVSNIDIGATLDNVFIGDTAGDSVTTGTNEVLIGDKAGAAVTTGAGNVLVGAEAGNDIDTGADNICIGDLACTKHTGTNSIIAIGADALDAATAPGDFNILIGENAGGAGVFTGAENVGVGDGVLEDNTTGANNVCIGGTACANATTSDDNIAIGDNALGGAISTGNGNICVGEEACEANTSGNLNVGIGEDSLKLMDTGAENVCVGNLSCAAHSSTGSVIAIGASAGEACVACGDGNIAIGEDSLSAGVATGVDNVCVGANTCEDVSTGTLNTCVGTDSCLQSTTADNSVAVGVDALGTGITTGNGNVAIGYKAGEDTTSAASNVCIGEEACAENDTEGAGVYIGFEVGKSALTPAANVLAIDNNDDATPLISGNFSTHLLDINGELSHQYTTVAADGTAQGDGAISGGSIVAVTGADSTKVVTLPAAPSAGSIYVVINTVAGQTLEVFPASGDAISALGANNAMTLAASTMAWCVAVSASQWWCGEFAAPA